MGLELPQTPWRLIRLDPPVQVFEAQFAPEDYTEDAGTAWGEVAVPRRVEPVLQWLRGEADTVSFKARFFNTGALDAAALARQGFGAVTGLLPTSERAVRQAVLGRDVARDVLTLKKCRMPDPVLGRPPRFAFEWGQDIRFDCVVQSLGGIKYGELWRFGQIRDVTFQIALRKVGADFDLERVDPSAKPHDSLYKPMATGGTYESLAARQYGSPILGVHLRQRNTAAFPQPGEVVRLPSADRFAKLRREPKSFSLSDDDRARAARLAAIDARTGSLELPFLVVG